MSRITISWPAGTITAVLRDTPTARCLLDALPVSGRANVWGEEVYFSVPFSADPDAATVVEKGAVCFWLDGDAPSLLFGPSLPYPFALTMMPAASCAFMTPVSPINAMVAAAEQHRFGDFVRMGLPLTLIAGVITVTLVPWLWPL